MASDLDRYLKARDDFFALATKISILSALIAFVVRARIAPKVDYLLVKWDALDFSYFVLIAPFFIFIGACIVYGRWLKLRAVRAAFLPGADSLSAPDRLLLDLPSPSASTPRARGWRRWLSRAQSGAAGIAAGFGGLWYFLIPPLALLFVFATLTDAYVLLKPEAAGTEAACKAVGGGKWFTEDGGFCAKGLWSAMLAFTDGNRFVHPAHPATKFPWVYPQTQGWAILILLIAATSFGAHGYLGYCRQALGLKQVPEKTRKASRA